MKKLKAYIYILAAVLLLYTLINLLAPKNINWIINLKPDNTNPYGTYVLKESLPDLFPNKKISNNEKNFYYLNNNYKEDAPKQTMIIINNRTFVDKYTINQLLLFVENGNTVFYSSHNICDALLDTLNIDESIANLDFGHYKESAQLYIRNKNYKLEDSIHIKYSYYKYLEDIDSIPYPHKVLGYISVNYGTEVNFIKIDIGKGSLYLHTSPLAFTNFNILKNYTKTYTEDVFDFLPDNDILWDFSMNKIKKEDSSIFKYLFKYKTVKYAYFLFIILFIIYGINSFIRKQRIIPIVEPPKNSSLELVSSIAELYIHEADHKNLSEKIIRHFSDYISQKYRITTKNFDDNFVEKLMNKSHKDIAEIKELVAIIKHIQAKKQVEHEEVLNLHKSIENFKNPENK